MIPVDLLMTFIVASTLLGLAPGPDNIFVLTQSALYGRQAGLLVTLGLCSGLIFHTLIVALGVAVLFQTSATALTVLKFVGAFYLLYLAWHAFTVSSNQLSNSKQKKLARGQLYRRGIIMNITNPKVSIFFLAFLAQFTAPEQGPVIFQLLLLGGIFILITLIVFGTIAFLAGTLGAWLSHSPKAQVYLNHIAGTVFIMLAIRLLTFEVSL